MYYTSLSIRVNFVWGMDLVGLYSESWSHIDPYCAIIGH